jgi:Zn-dependent M28 family amino/carboxypeptidase
VMLASVGMIFGMLFVALTCIIFAFSGGDWDGGYRGPWLVVGALQLLCLPGLLSGFFFNNFNVVSPGANDNLSGALITAGLARQLGEAGIRTENTEIVFLITGSEEAGLRGAKAFAAKHAVEFRDVETIFIGVDTIRDLAHMKVYNRDMNGIVNHDAKVCQLLKDAGTACGLELTYGSAFIGSSDATAFTQAGVPSVALIAMDPAPAPYYHTRLDNWDNMDKECLRKCIELVAKAIEMYDKDGLSPAQT